MKFMMRFLGIAIGGMNIASSCIQRFVTEKNLDRCRVSALFGQISGEAVAQ